MRDRIETELPKVAQPALVVRGTRDAIAPQEWCEEAARLLPRGRLALIDGVSHAVNWNAAPRFSAIVAEFVDLEVGGA